MEGEPGDQIQNCFGAGSVAGAVIGTFLTTILLLTVAALIYRQWRKHKGKHLVLVTDPEIVEDAYAFDNPCFKDVSGSVGRILERPVPVVSVDTPGTGKDSTRWSTSWTSLALGSANRSDKRRTLDDSCLGPKATRVSVVSLKSRDFTGLGFNVCGNMREGIFVKDLLHRGPASESGRIHPGDRIASVKISFRNMVYEDALTILSYASPYDVELEVENGGSGSKPTTLLKKSVGPSTARICHPLYRSQSIPELSQARNIAKRLFIADPNESVSSNYSTMNSTLKSAKTTPSSQTFERRQEESKGNHHKFGIKVLPALDGTVHRIENQNEHNTNLERRHSKKIDAEKHIMGNVSRTSIASNDVSFTGEEKKVRQENLQQRENPQASLSADTKRASVDARGVDTLDRGTKNSEAIDIPSEVPTEVHNAAMAARRNRRNSADLLNAQRNTAANMESVETEGAKSPQKNKRRAPAPPKGNTTEAESGTRKDLTSPKGYDSKKEDAIDSIVDYADTLTDYVSKARESTDEGSPVRGKNPEAPMVDRRNSESDTDSEVQNSFTTIELNSADITIHRTPVPEAKDDEDMDDDDVYRKAASLGDLSKYECRASSTLERAQSLDMTDTGSKKRKAPLPPEDINESTEDLTKLDQADTFDRRKLKKSNEWGTLEDVVWNKKDSTESKSKTRTRKKSNGTLERSKSSVEIKMKDETPGSPEMSDSGDKKDENEDTSAELYSLPLSKKLTEELIRAERMFDPYNDDSLARIVNNGNIVKSPTLEEVELDFRQTTPLPDDTDDGAPVENESSSSDILPTRENPPNEEFGRALRYFEMHSTPQITPEPTKVASFRLQDKKELASTRETSNDEPISYVGKKAVVEELITKVNVQRGCRACEERTGQCDACDKKSSSKPVHLRVYPSKSDSMLKEDEKKASNANRTSLSAGWPAESPRTSSIEVPSSKKPEKDEDEDEDEYEFGSGVTVNSKSLSDREDRRNINNSSVSSGENSEDSGLVGESMDYNQQDFENRPPLPSTPMPQKLTYITEIKVSANRENVPEQQKERGKDKETDQVLSASSNKGRKPQHDTKVTSNGKTTTSSTGSAGKKPPVPPRRSDVTKTSKDEQAEKQVVFVSEYRTPGSKETDDLDKSQEAKQSENGSKKFEQWIFLGDRDQNRWGRGCSQPQTITNIVLSSGDDKIVQQ